MQGSTVYEPNGWKPFPDVLNIVGIGMLTYKIIYIKLCLRLSVSAVKIFFLTQHQ